MIGEHMNDDSKVVSEREVIINQMKSLPINKIIQHIPLEDLVKEIRRRKLSKNINGTLIISDNGNVKFALENMPWPIGEYEIVIHCVKEIQHEQGNSNDSEK